MSNLRVNVDSLRERLICSEQRIVSERGSVAWRELAGSRRLFACHGRCVMIRTGSQMATATALIELQGVAKRIVLCPAELSDNECLSVARLAEVEVVVLDQPWEPDKDDGWPTALEFERVLLEDVLHSSQCTEAKLLPNDLKADAKRPAMPTEWVLLTSGTTDAPKLVVHTFQSLTCGIEWGDTLAASVVWSTFYDIRRYGGLQIFLRAALTGAMFVLSSKHETVSEYLCRARRAGVTHISGTPSHWRRALMTTSAGQITPRYVRLSGEIADQTILDQLRLQYPQSAIVHAFASTEAGVAIEVNDGLAGVPEDRLGRHGDVEIKIEAETMRVRSPRTASRYLGQRGPGSPPLKADDGFVDTGDLLALAHGRYLFGGRQDGTINVGGLKVHPEEVESVLNSHPEISLSLVRAKASPLVGALVIADVVLRGPELDALEAARVCREGITLCREKLPAYKVPVSIRAVSSLPITDTGKLARANA